MKHQEYQELIVLRLYGELSPEEGVRLDDHLLSCASCREEAAVYSKLLGALEEHGPKVPVEDLVQARGQLLDSLSRADRRGTSDRWSIRHLASVFRPGFLFARAGAAVGLIGVGLLLGFFAFSPGEGALGLPGLLDPFRNKDLDITSVRFEQTDPQSNSVILSFNVAREVRLEGDLDDPEIQRVLAYALISEDNPGVRLRAVNAIGTEGQPDQETVAALIGAMKTDANPAVRHQALLALSSYPSSNEIKQAFAEVLLEDKNARLRIEAIDALQAAVEKGARLDPDMVNELGRRLVEDENSYIRRKARTFLTEAGYSAN